MKNRGGNQNDDNRNKERIKNGMAKIRKTIGKIRKKEG
jgi:hypothetical protein